MNVTVDALATAWGWALVQFLWQGMAIGAVALLLLTLSRHAKPQVRYAITGSALLLCVIVPIVSVVQALSVAPQGLMAGFAAAGPSSSSNAGHSTAANLILPDAIGQWLPGITYLWCFGCLFFGLRMALGLSWITRLKAQAWQDRSREWQSAAARMAKRLGMNRDITLLVSEAIDSPMTSGWWKPVIYMPATLFTHLSADLIDALIAHELAHIKRHDYLVNLAQCVIEAVLFFHPVIWWLSAQIRVEREHIADDLAATAIGNPTRLASALAALDQYQFTGLHLVQAAQGGNLMSRIQRLIKPARQPFNWKTATLVAVLTLLGFTIAANGKTGVLGTQRPDGSAATQTVAVTETPADIKAGETKSARDSYALVIAGKNGLLLSGSTDDIDRIEAARKSHAGDFLWFKRGQNAYIIQDPAILADAKAAWKDSDALSAEMDTISKEMDKHSHAMDEISRRMDAVSGHGATSSAAMESLGSGMATLGTQQERLSRSMAIHAEAMAGAKTPAERMQQQREMAALQVKMDTLNREMESLSRDMEKHSTTLDQSMQPLDALSKEMDIASKPMEALGKEMEAIGKRMEAISQKADRQVTALLEQSLVTGKAKQLP